MKCKNKVTEMTGIETAIQQILHQPPVMAKNRSKDEIIRLKRLFLNVADEATCGMFKIDDSNKQIVSDLFNYFIGIPGKLDLNKGIWLDGPIGTGKSTLMFVFSKFMQRINDGFRVYICSQVAAEYALTGNIDKYLLNPDGFCKEPVPMCFDELGREPIPSKYFGTELNVFQHILHIRYALWQQTHLKTYVTTNLMPDEVQNIYGDYIRDRRKEMFNLIAVTGYSRRKV